MEIKSVQLRHFRNYEAVEIPFGSGMNLIYGANAQGKTNLLESLVVLSLTKSHRLNDDRRMIQTGSEFARISCVVHEERDTRLDVILHPGGKTLMVNGTPVKKSSEFIGRLNVVLFSPDDMRIYKDAPRERRRMIDREISKLSGRYMQALSVHQALIKNRNMQLKNPHPDMELLKTLEYQLAEVTEPIMKERQAFIDEVNEAMPEIYRELSLTDGTVKVIYEPNLFPGNKEELLRQMEESRAKDLQYSTTGKGIHYDDLRFEADGMNILWTGSQGQKRMCLLAFKIALLEAIRRRTGKKAVLLLDDVLSELDAHRQQALLKRVQSDYQCMITSVILPKMSTEDITRICIENGTFVPQKKGTK